MDKMKLSMHHSSVSHGWH